MRVRHKKPIDRLFHIYTLLSICGGKGGAMLHHRASSGSADYATRAVPRDFCLGVFFSLAQRHLLFVVKPKKCFLTVLHIR